MRPMGNAVLRALALGAALCLADASALSADEPKAPPAPKSVLDGVERAATLCARAGRRDDTTACLSMLDQFGRDAASLAKAREACEKALAKVLKPAPAPPPEASKAVKRAAAELAATL